MYIFTEPDIRRAVKLNPEAIAVVEEGFIALGEDRVQTPPILRVDFPDVRGEVDVKTAAVAGFDLFAIKISAGFFNNFQLGLPSGNGLMVLLNTTTGEPVALLLDNGYLTNVRTAAAGALAAKHMAPQNISTVGVIGTGAQARLQIEALQYVRRFQQVLVYGRTRSRAEACAEELRRQLQLPVAVADSAEHLVKDSQVVITTTPSSEPIVLPQWLHNGLHITAIGSDAEHKQELHGEVLARAHRVVCDLIRQSQVLGELRGALQTGALKGLEAVTELGKIAAGSAPARQTDDEITVCDLTGTGVQDTAIAVFAYNTLRKAGAGMEI